MEPVAIGCKNWMLADLKGVLERVADHKVNKLDGLRQWNYLPETQVQDAYLLYRGLFIKNFLRYLAEKTLLLKTTNFRGITLELPRHRRDQISAYVRTARHLRETAQQV